MAATLLWLAWNAGIPKAKVTLQICRRGLAAPNTLLRTGANQHRLVVYGCGMLIDGRRCLGAAVAVFSVELQRAYPMLTVDALENAAILDARVSVMSHSLNCSPHSETFRRTMVTG